MQNSTTITDIVMVMVASFAVFVVAKKGGKEGGGVQILRAPSRGGN
jgi:hypothetical protein